MGQKYPKILDHIPVNRATRAILKDYLEAYYFRPDGLNRDFDPEDLRYQQVLHGDFITEKVFSVIKPTRIDLVYLPKMELLVLLHFPWGTNREEIINFANQWIKLLHYVDNAPDYTILEVVGQIVLTFHETT